MVVLGEGRGATREASFHSQKGRYVGGTDRPTLSITSHERHVGIHTVICVLSTMHPLSARLARTRHSLAVETKDAHTRTYIYRQQCVHV